MALLSDSWCKLSDEPQVRDGSFGRAHWRKRPPEAYAALYSGACDKDHHLENVRQNGQVRDAAILMASSVNMAG